MGGQNLVPVMLIKLRSRRVDYICKGMVPVKVLNPVNLRVCISGCVKGYRKGCKWGRVLNYIEDLFEKKNQIFFGIKNIFYIYLDAALRKVCELQVNPLNQLMESGSQAKIVRYALVILFLKIIFKILINVSYSIKNRMKCFSLLINLMDNL